MRKKDMLREVLDGPLVTNFYTFVDITGLSVLRLAILIGTLNKLGRTTTTFNIFY